LTPNNVPKINNDDGAAPDRVLGAKRAEAQMLWAYFDESGEHDVNGQLIKLTLGGSLATYETWGMLSEKWNKILKEFGIEMFHMADFEAIRDLFKGEDS
jgi:hypothetical protein